MTKGKTMFYNFNEFLKQKNIDTTTIEKYIKDDLQQKKIETGHLRNKKADQQLQEIILPTVSSYYALLNSGIGQEQAVLHIQEYVLDYYKKLANLYKTFGRLPNFFFFFRKAFPTAMKLYPTEHWHTQWIKNDKEGIFFDMTSCLYYDTFYKYKCEKLTTIFCGVDDFCYGNMSKQLSFVRTKTIGRGNECCDFKFIKVK